MKLQNYLEQRRYAQNNVTMFTLIYRALGTPDSVQEGEGELARGIAVFTFSVLRPLFKGEGQKAHF